MDGHYFCILFSCNVLFLSAICLLTLVTVHGTFAQLQAIFEWKQCLPTWHSTSACINQADTNINNAMHAHNLMSMNWHRQSLCTKSRVDMTVHALHLVNLSKTRIQAARLSLRVHNPACTMSHKSATFRAYYTNQDKARLSTLLQVHYSVQRCRPLLSSKGCQVACGAG